MKTETIKLILKIFLILVMDLCWNCLKVRKIYYLWRDQIRRDKKIGNLLQRLMRNQKYCVRIEINIFYVIAMFVKMQDQFNSN